MKKGTTAAETVLYGSLGSGIEVGSEEAFVNLEEDEETMGVVVVLVDEVDEVVEVDDVEEK